MSRTESNTPVRASASTGAPVAQGAAHASAVDKAPAASLSARDKSVAQSAPGFENAAGESVADGEASEALRTCTTTSCGHDDEPLSSAGETMGEPTAPNGMPVVAPDSPKRRQKPVLRRLQLLIALAIALTVVIVGVVVVAIRSAGMAGELAEPNMTSEAGPMDADAAESLAVANDELSRFRCRSDLKGLDLVQATDAAEALDGTVVAAGGTISLLEFVGTGVDGQGVQMVASALYVASLEGGLDVIERHAGKEVVAWMPPGLDAMIGEGVGDLVIANRGKTPVRMSVQADEHGVTAAVVGTRETGVTRETGSRVVDSVSYAAGDVYADLGSLDADDVVEYVVVESRLSTYRNGKVTDNEVISLDTYRVSSTGQTM